MKAEKRTGRPRRQKPDRRDKPNRRAVKLAEEAYQAMLALIDDDQDRRTDEERRALAIRRQEGFDRRQHS